MDGQDELHLRSLPRVKGLPPARPRRGDLLNLPGLTLLLCTLGQGEVRRDEIFSPLWLYRLQIQVIG